MHSITDADREAAHALRELLADISGFWHRTGDDSPLCQALAQHRLEGEQRLANKLAPFLIASPSAKMGPVGEHSESVPQSTICLPRFWGPLREPGRHGSKS